MKLDLPETLYWSDNALYLLDQRLLPHKIQYLEMKKIQDTWDAIKTLAVRGAPAIGVAAAYGLAQSMQGVAPDQFDETLQANGAYLKSARPTAVNLAWAVDRLVANASSDAGFGGLLEDAQSIHREDLEICMNIGRHGAPLIKSGSSVLTHCNAGSLAVSRYGTATAPMYVQHQNGVTFKVFADETRPLYQGARLTAWELDQAGIDVTLICDNMAATHMSRGLIDLVVVGTDRVTANGDVINKIGTLGVAILAQYFNIPFYVACPSSTFDAMTPTGADVEIEERDPAEVIGKHGAAVKVSNPAFDVTPHSLVTGIITEDGIYQPQELVQRFR
ncbi:MAG: S-methyl-5-thioribose-1-phosphate isomerase [Pseudomonadota bacterium]